MIISEQEKNRIRKLHKNYSIIKEQDNVKGKEETSSIQGISSELLHTNTLDFIESQQKITTQMLLKMIAGCTENGPLKRFYFGSPATYSSDNRVEPNKLIKPKTDGTLYLGSTSGQHAHEWDNLCNLSNNSDSTWTNLEGWPIYEKDRTAILTNYLKNWVDSLQNSVSDDQLDAETANRYAKGGRQLTWKSVGNDQWTLAKK